MVAASDRPGVALTNATNPAFERLGDEANAYSSPPISSIPTYCIR
jgi:hypothetical protein